MRTAVFWVVVCHLVEGASAQSHKFGPSEARTERPASPAVIELGEPDWRFAHPNAALLAGMNMERLVRSPLTRTLLSQIAASRPAAAAEVESLIAVLGKVDQVCLSMRPGAAKGAPDLLLLVTGQVDDPSLAPLFHNSAALRSRSVGPNATLIGLPDSLDQATRRLGSPSQSGVQSKVQRNGFQYVKDSDFWFTGSPAMVAAMAFLPADQLPAGVRGISFGMYFRDQVSMNIALELPSAEAAGRLLESARNEIGTSASGVQSRVDARGSSVYFTMVVPQNRVTQAMASAGIGEKLGTQLGPLLAAIRAQAASLPAPKPAPARHTIVIDGLDSGQKEVPFSQHVTEQRP